MLVIYFKFCTKQLKNAHLKICECEFLRSEGAIERGRAPFALRFVRCAGGDGGAGEGGGGDVAEQEAEREAGGGPEAAPLPRRGPPRRHPGQLEGFEGRHDVRRVVVQHQLMAVLWRRLLHRVHRPTPPSPLHQLHAALSRRRPSSPSSAG